MGKRLEQGLQDRPTSAQLLRITNESRDVARTLQRLGPSAIASEQAAQDTLASLNPTSLTEAEATNALLFLLLSANQQYDMGNFVMALEAKQLDWNLVIQGFDLDQVQIKRSSQESERHSVKQ